MRFFDENKKAMKMTLFICAIVFVVWYAITNFSAVSGLWSAVLKVLSPIIIGFAIAYILNPLLRLFEFKVYKKIPSKSVIRALSIVSTYVVALLFIAAFIFMLVPQLIDAIVMFVSNINTYLDNTIDFVNGIINKFSTSDTFKEYVNSKAVMEYVTKFFNESGNLMNTVLNYAMEYGMGLVTVVKNAILGIFISIYVFISKEKLQAQIKKFASAVFPESKNKTLGKYIMLTHRTFSSYFVGKLIGSLLVWLLMLTLLSICGVPYALLISTIVAITDIIPVFGPIIGAIPSFFIIFVVDPTKALIFVIVLLIVQQIEGNIISPKILGEATGISSLSVIVAIVVMGEYFGFIGMIIGVPVFAVCITVGKEWLDSRLKERGKSTDTDDYYLTDAFVDPHAEHHVPIGRKMYLNIKKLVVGIMNKFKKSKEAEQTKQTEQTEQTDKENNGNGSES